MERNSKTIVFTCANEAVIQQLAVFLSSIRDTNSGAYFGKVVVLTDQKTNNLELLCQKYSAELFESSFESFGGKLNRIADYACLVEYRNKKIFLVKAINKLSGLLGKCIIRITSPMFTLDALLMRYKISLILYEVKPKKLQ